jgi:hypothetical protein
MVLKPVVISWATAVVAPRFIEGAIDRARGRPGIKLTERDKGVAARFIALGWGGASGEVVPHPSAINVAATPFTSRLREHYEECDTPVA